jgi:hypothetical protein
VDTWLQLGVKLAWLLDGQLDRDSDQEDISNRIRFIPKIRCYMGAIQ